MVNSMKINSRIYNQEKVAFKAIFSSIFSSDYIQTVLFIQVFQLNTERK